jgi:uncharacterized protein YcnI
VNVRARVRIVSGAAVAAALLLPASAWAHATISPPVAKAKVLQQFALSVPTEKENAKTTKIELTVPSGFAIDSFEPEPGWTRSVKQQGSGEEATVQGVTWSGGSVPTEEDAVFRFNASANSSKKYTFTVRQTYSDGSVVDWSGPESSDTPAPVVEAVSDLGGGGGSSTVEIIALVVAVIAAVLAVAALLAGRRSLT